MKKPWKERKRKKEEKEIAKIHTYEDNLKLHYDSKRKELDLLLSASLPHQINNIKMILWINFLFFGLSITIFKNLQFYCIYFIPYFLSLCAIISMLVALTKRRSKKYGSIDKLDYVSEDIKDGRYAKSKMLSGLLHNTYDAVEYNRNTLQKISKYLRFSIISTSIAIILFFTLVIVLNFDIKNSSGEEQGKSLMVSLKEKVVILDEICISMKRNSKMSDSDKKPVPSEVTPPQRPIHEAEERGHKSTPPPKKDYKNE